MARINPYFYIDETSLAKLSTTNTFTGNQIWNNSVNLGPGLNASVGFEIGYTGGSATTPYIDFHSGATATDFDSRIIASGGTGTNGAGTLTYTAGAHNFTGVITSQNSVTSQAGLALSGASSPLTLNGSTGTTGQVLTSAGAGTTPTWSSSFISTTSNYFAGHNPEGRLMYNTYLTNDMANARLRGSAVAATQNGVAYSISNANWDAMFDGTASFFNISPTSGFTFPLVITVPLPRTLTYGAWVGLSFGSTTFRANSVTIEVFSLDSSSWVTIFTTTTNTSEDIFAAVSGLTNGNATGINQVRYTISAPNSTQLRLQHLWAYNFNSDMWSQTMMPRAGGTIYGAITVPDRITLKAVANAANQSNGLLLSNTIDTWQSGLYLKTDGSGNPRLTLLAPTGALGEAVSIDAAAKVGFNNIAPTGQVDITTASTTRVPLIIRPQASQTSDLFQVRNSADNANLFRVTNSGDASFGALALGSGTIYGSSSWLNIALSSASQIGSIIRGATSQSSDLSQWQTWNGTTATTVAYVRNDGLINSSAGFTGPWAWINGYRANTTLAATANNDSAPTVIFRATASQTQDLLRFESSTPSTLSYIKPDGSFYVNSNSNNTGIYFKGTASDQSIRANGNDLFITPRFDLIFQPTDTTGRLRPANDNQADLGTSGQRWKNIYGVGAILNGLTLSSTTSPITLDSSTGTSGQILISGGAGATPSWTSSPTVSTLTADQVLATNNGNGTNFKVGDDVWLGDINVANTMSLKGQQSATSGYIRFGGDSNAFGYDGTKLSYAGNLTTSGLTLSSTTSPIILNASAGTSGQVLTSAGAGATPTWTTVSGGSFTGGTLTSNLTLVAGSTTTYPLTFQNNGVAPNANLGSMDFSSSTGLQFTNNATTGKGSVNVSHIYSIASDGATYTTDSTVSAFPALTNGISLESGVRYEFEGVLMLYNFATFFSSGTTSCTLTLGFALPTVTYAHADFNYSVGTSSTFGSATDTLTYNAVTTALGTGVGISTATRSTAGTDNRYAYVRVSGHLKTSASGNFRPTVNYAGTGIGGYGGNIMAGSWISIRKTPETMGVWT